MQHRNGWMRLYTGTPVFVLVCFINNIVFWCDRLAMHDECAYDVGGCVCKTFSW